MISLDKKYMTKDGEEVKLFTVDSPAEDEEVVGAIKCSGDIWVIHTWTKEGFFSKSRQDHFFNLIEVVESTYRPFTFEEGEKVVGQVVKYNRAGMSTQLVTAVWNQYDIIRFGIGTNGNKYPAEDFLKCFTFLDGSPCGVENHGK